jgi:hypothetical protein
MKRNYKLLIFLFIIAALSISCAQDADTGTKSFFSDTELITITNPVKSASIFSSGINFTAPSKCAYIVIGLFSSIPISSSTNLIQNYDALKYGLRGGSDWAGVSTTINAADLKAYSVQTSDFTGALYTTAAMTEPNPYLLIWGYDSQMNLVASSEARLVLP